MSATAIAITDVAYRRLLELVEQTGWPATVILEQALADYDRKLSREPNAANGRSTPIAAEEAELLEDSGRIRVAPRDVRSVVAHIVPVGRRMPRLDIDAED